MLITLLWSLLGFVWMLSPLMCVKGMNTETTFSFIPKSLEKVIDIWTETKLIRI